MNISWRGTMAGLAFVAGLLVLRFVSGSPHLNEPGFVKEQRSLMGTLWTIEAADRGRTEEARLAIDKAYAELARIDRLMSEWRPDSPISQVNAAAGQHPVEVPAELRELVERSIRYSQITEGTFDVTWRGMGNIWHFDDSFRVPGAAEVAAARRHIDYRRIRIEGNSLYLPKGSNIGLGGIAKGYAIDRAARVLADAGFSDVLVDGGGDVWVSGKPDGREWRLGIQDPRKPHGEILGVASVSGMALVTSGDYERFRIVNGVRYHHIIDPRTGWPATASISVSVMAKSAEQGVVLAKGIYMLGPVRGLELARREGVEAMVVDPARKEYFTEGFRRAFRAE
ncbi:MAG: FAD:protein FMN transferase [Acidobacteriota bacterium]|nr:FAD:protein FMN transferase [Acidobacteriota bacterium]